MDIWVTGGAWITAGGYGVMKDKKKIPLIQGEPVVPKGKDIFVKPMQRYGRFDLFTKLGCAAVAMTLKDGGEQEFTPDNEVGMVISTKYEVIKTDVRYYETTQHEDGRLASPNLFSYTLPVILLGECAVLNQLTGPTFCVGESDGKGENALRMALDMISSGKTNKMIAGWVDDPPKEVSSGEISGAVSVLLSTSPGLEQSAEKKIRYNNGRIENEKGSKILSLLDFF